MARKEKSNYTEENSQFKRKQAKAGRPKKPPPVKEQSKQSRTDIETYSADTNNSIESEGNLDNTKLASCENSINESTSLDESRSSRTEYDGMPRLSPITDGARAGDASTGSSVAGTRDEGSSNDVDKPFLKPVAGRSRRERGRPRSNPGGARKIAKSDSFEGKAFAKTTIRTTMVNKDILLRPDGSPSIAETGKNNDYPEGSFVRSKSSR